MELGLEPIKIVLNAEEDAYLLFRNVTNRTRLQLVPFVEARTDKKKLVELSIAFIRENFLSANKISVYGNALTPDNLDLLDNAIIVGIADQYIGEILKKLGIGTEQPEKKTESEEPAKDSAAS